MLLNKDALFAAFSEWAIDQHEPDENITRIATQLLRIVQEHVRAEAGIDRSQSNRISSAILLDA